LDFGEIGNILDTPLSDFTLVAPVVDGTGDPSLWAVVRAQQDDVGAMDSASMATTVQNMHHRRLWIPLEFTALADLYATSLLTSGA
jgi:N-methylhydantoinase B/oxoprolinase/acetone carboxylase alpha subunit